MGCCAVAEKHNRQEETNDEHMLEDSVNDTRAPSKKLRKCPEVHHYMTFYHLYPKLNHITEGKGLHICTFCLLGDEKVSCFHFTKIIWALKSIFLHFPSVDLPNFFMTSIYQRKMRVIPAKDLKQEI